MNTAKSYKLIIFNDTYTIRSDEPEEHILQAAKMLDEIMHDIAQKLSLTASAKNVAVLAALRIASKLMASEKIINACEDKEFALHTFIDTTIESYMKAQ